MEVTSEMFNKSINYVGAISASMGNNTSRLAQSHVTVANQIVYAAIVTHQKETYRESPDPFFPVCDTESGPHWGWLGLACVTKSTLYM